MPKRNRKGERSYQITAFTQNTSVRLPIDERKLYKKIAQEKGTTLSAMIVEALRYRYIR